MSLGNPSVGDLEGRQVWVLEEAVVWLVLLLAQSVGNVFLGIVPSSLKLGDLALAEKIDMSTIFVLDSALDILGACYVLDLNTVSADFVRMYRHVHIDSHLALIYLGIGNLKLLKQLL